MSEVVVTTGAVICAKLQSNVTTNKPTLNFLQAGCSSCHPANSVKALKGKEYIINNNNDYTGIFEKYLD